MWFGIMLYDTQSKNVNNVLQLQQFPKIPKKKLGPSFVLD